MASTTITKRGEVWQYRIQYIVDGNRKSVSKSGFKTKRDAKEAAVLKENELNKLVDESLAKMKLGDFIERWFELYKKNKVSYRTEETYTNVISLVRNHYNIPLKQIHLDSYQDFLNQLAVSYKASTLRKYNHVIKSVMNYAVNIDALPKNVIQHSVVSGNPSKSDEHKFLSFEQFKQLEKFLWSDISSEYSSRYVILFSMYTGARFSECLGMTWDCVDFDNKTVKIEKGFDYRKSKQFSSLKTDSSKRTISIPDVLIQLLLTLPHNHHHNMIFKPIRLQVANNDLKKIAGRLGISQDLTFHGLRHTHASILLSQGVNILSVSKRLGHKKVSMTLDVYSHVIQELELADTDKINKIF